MKRCCQSFVVFFQTIIRSKSKEKGKGRECGKYLNKKQNKQFTTIYCRRSMSMIENHNSGYLNSELFNKSNEEKCTFFQRMAWSLILHKNPIKNCSIALQAFTFRSLFVSFISFFIKARMLLQFLSQAFSILYMCIWAF